MIVENKFSTTAFGGFKKEEVISYIDALMTKSDEEIAALKNENTKLSGQIAEFKAIVEEQYAKIVELNEKNEVLSQENKTNEEKIELLNRKLEPYVQAKTKADEVLENAQAEAQSLLDNMNRQISLAAEQTKLIFSQANEKEKELIADATDKAETILAIAREKEAKMFCDAQKQIENTVALSEENKLRAKRLIDGAQREAQQIIAKAKAEAKEQKGDYDKVSKELEAQKSKLLLSLDEIKAYVQNIQIMHLPKTEGDPFTALCQNTTEAIKKRFVMLNKERQCGDNKD